MSLQSLKAELGESARREGCDLFGIADITPAHKFICRQGGDFLREFPRAISISVRLLDAIVNHLDKHESPPIIYTYQFHVYNVVNSLLDRIALKISKRLQKDGYQTYTVPSTQIVDLKKLIGTVSHKLVAHLAGLGWIGKSCLLITPNYGPRVRFATILTDAPFASGSPMPGRCGECRECVDICPPKAFTGVPFNPSEPRRVRFKAHLCREYSNQRRKTILPYGPPSNCGLCVYICPFGKK